MLYFDIIGSVRRILTGEKFNILKKLRLRNKIEKTKANKIHCVWGLMLVKWVVDITIRCA